MDWLNDPLVEFQLVEHKLLVESQARRQYKKSGTPFGVPLPKR